MNASNSMWNRERNERDAAFPSTCRESPLEMPVYSTRDLFSGKTEIGIDHQGARYRLRITRQGKLILYK